MLWVFQVRKVGIESRGMEKTDKEKAKGTRNSKPKSLMGLQKAQQKHELIAWPPSFFPCGFCEKTFKSAQGLGGHMNVHRRERARLRESPAPSSSSCVGESSANSLLISPSLGTGFLESSAGRIDDKMAATIMGYRLCDLSSPQNGEMTYKSSSTESGFFGKGPIARDGGDSVGLDLEMGLTVGGSRKEDLDLELRLGYP